MNVKEFYEKHQRDYLKKVKERKILIMPENLGSKVIRFYANGGKEKLENFKDRIYKKYKELFILEWDNKKGLLFIISAPDSGADFDDIDNEFVWANVYSEKIKEPILKIIKQYKSLLNKN